jgi:uncharacterized protein YprB with RNaseH-like and TPR domain
LEGRLVETEAGRCFIVEEVYPATYVHGRFCLKEFLDVPVERWALLAGGDVASPLSPQSMVFLDIETTGLSDDAGTYAFLVGLGRFEDETFWLRQVFMRSPAEEGALLLAVEGLLRGAEGLITYNGRGFDLPVLQSRYTLAHMSQPWKGKVHLDLLPWTRRIWQARLARCNLSTVEGQLLGVERSLLDLPGWRIPSLYHAYLRGEDASSLRPVFYHNAQDILSMVPLAARLATFLNDPWGDGGARHGLEFYALGRLYEQWGDSETAIAAYRGALLLAMPVEYRERAWQRLSLLFKRRGAWSEALEIWRSLVGRQGHRPLYAYVELAKYYEHHRRDLAQAEAVTRQAIIEFGEQPKGDDLRHRLDRLCRKQKQRSKKEDRA